MTKMTLYKWVREEIEKLSFINKTKFTGMYLYLFYDKDGEEKIKRIPYRAKPKQVLDFIEKIKEDIDYYKKREIHIKNYKKTERERGNVFVVSADVKPKGDKN
ncbi:hypothetical protein [Oceanihabitans sediminis]|uniref:hypothetical protein n=1 Tax=Oceanihabitans sediminis TaxID=1812012 RepID=UPI00299CFC2F|nr:hypothetical protein [Oceanihabitans sediminis]MDX1279517.1 hypothetical protein [Oceanihabitans sediminis]